MTFTELCEWLKTLDEVTLLELLDISAEDIVDRFEDRVEENFTRLSAEKEQI
jgi:hypothetical protein